jgi:hypothetical protein
MATLRDRDYAVAAICSGNCSVPLVPTSCQISFAAELDGLRLSLPREE